MSCFISLGIIRGFNVTNIAKKYNVKYRKKLYENSDWHICQFEIIFLILPCLILKWRQHSEIRLINNE